MNSVLDYIRPIHMNKCHFGSHTHKAPPSQKVFMRLKFNCGKHLGEPSWFPDPSETSLHRWECGLQTLTASGTGGSHTASGADPVSGSRHPGTFPDRGEVSIPPGRALQEQLGEPSLIRNLSETRLCRWECELQKLHSFWDKQKQHNFWER
jgi:hypothetical protein